MQKKYEAPKLSTMGDLRSGTMGEGLAGNDDTFLWIFRYGTDPS